MMKLNLCFLSVLFLFVSCSYWKPYYIVNESNNPVKLELTLKNLSDTSQLVLKYIDGIDRLQDFDSENSKKLKLFVKNNSSVFVYLPAKTTLYLTSISSPSDPISGKGTYVILNHFFIQGNRIENYSKDDFMKKLKGKHWYSFVEKSYFIYK